MDRGGGGYQEVQDNQHQVVVLARDLVLCYDSRAMQIYNAIIWTNINQDISMQTKLKNGLKMNISQMTISY